MPRKPTPAADVPLKELEAFVLYFDDKETMAMLAKAQKAAWYEYADTTLKDRFRVKQHPNGWGFSQRSLDYSSRRLGGDRAARKRAGPLADPMVTKTDLPDYVFSGEGKRYALSRKPVASRSGDSVTTKRSIWFRALNSMGNKYGWQVQREVKQTKTVQRPAHVRRSPTGKPVAVRSYQQTAHVYSYTGTPSSKSYAQEWEFRQEEIDAVARRSQALFLAALRKKGFTKAGGRKASFRKMVEAHDNRDAEG